MIQFQPDIQTIAFVIGAFAQACGLVWGAARITSRVEFLSRSFSEFKQKDHERMRDVEEVQDDHTTKIAILWDGREMERKTRVKNKHADVDIDL